MHGEVRLLFAAAGLLKEEVSKCIGRVGDFVSVLLSCHEMEKNGGSIVWGGNVSRVLEWMGTGDSVVEICGIDFEGRLKEVGERVAGVLAREEWRKKSGDERAAQSFRPRTSGDKLRCSNCAAHPAQLKAPGPGRPRTR